jgi:hypothetical protein
MSDDKKSLGDEFKINSDTDIRAILIRNSLCWMFGRTKENGRLLYPFLSRIILLFQKPIAVIIYDDLNLSNYVFKSLDKEKNFGDQELAYVFEGKLEKIRKEDLAKCAFNFFGTRYYIVFFIIEYDINNCDIKNVSFKPVIKDSENADNAVFNCKYGSLVQFILEENEYSKTLRFSNFVADAVEENEIINGLDIRFFKEFNKFPWGIKDNEEEFKLDELEFLESKHGEEIEELIEVIRSSTLIKKIHNHISSIPLIKVDNIGFNNFFIILKTATIVREDEERKYRFPYTLRLMLCDKQKEKIKEHYKKIADSNGKHCTWYKEQQCCIKGKSGKNIGACIFGGNSPMLVDDFITNIEHPFEHERSILDTSLSSGILGVVDVYPDLTRGHTKEELSFTLWKENNINISSRQACSLCVSHQTVPFKDGVKAKAIITPITTNGVTNMAVFTMSAVYEGEEEKEWMLIYSRYLAVISRQVTQQVRIETKGLLLDAIKDAFSYHYVKCFNIGKKEFYPDKFVHCMNDATNKLAHIYPLHRVEFSQEDFNDVDGELKGKINLFRHKEDEVIYFTLRENRYFNRLHKFDYLKKEQVLKCLDDGRRDAGERLYVEIKLKDNKNFIKKAMNWIRG